MPIKKWLIESLTVVRLKELNAGQRSAGSSGHTSWAGFSEFFEVTKIQAHIEERERKSKGVEEASGSQWFCLDKMRVHSLNLYVPTLLPCAGSTLNSSRRFSNIVFR